MGIIKPWVPTREMAELLKDQNEFWPPMERNSTTGTKLFPPAGGLSVFLQVEGKPKRAVQALAGQTDAQVTPQAWPRGLWSPAHLRLLSTGHFVVLLTNRANRCTHSP